MTDPAASRQQPRVVVLTRPGCHLCSDAVSVIAAVCQETGDQWVERDITADAAATRRYTDQIPVTFVDGAQHDFWRVDARRLKAALVSASGRRS